MNLIEKIDKEQFHGEIPKFRPGDTLRVFCKIREGDKERIQIFEGVCTRRRRGGMGATFTVRKSSYGVGVERVFPIHSPLIEKIEVANAGKMKAKGFQMSQRRVHRRMRQQKLLDVPPPNRRRYEDMLHSQGIEFIAGVDEAGRGCLAGPVVAAAVILPKHIHISNLKDSKKLSEKQREILFDEIGRQAVALAVGVVDSQEIDRINILKASLLAMKLAVDELTVTPQFLLIDGPQMIEHRIPQRALIRGDDISINIAAASIIAKVSRDRMMCDLEPLYRPFKFSVHKGYGTALHRDELKRYGPTQIHRKTFRGVVL
jgi:ribonuclease HII